MMIILYSSGCDAGGGANFPPMVVGIDAGGVATKAGDVTPPKLGTGGCILFTAVPATFSCVLPKAAIPRTAPMAI
jgi:hypothetical protein